MVIKTAMMGIPVLASRSGFTAWGVEIANEVGLALIGRMKGQRFVCLAGEDRLIRDADPSVISRADSPEEITKLFGDVVYFKGAAIVRMFEHALGGNVFLEGIRDYMKTHQYGSVISEDFYTAVDAVVAKDGSTLPKGVTVAEAMSTWMRQPLHPVILVERNETNPNMVRTKLGLIHMLFNEEPFLPNLISTGPHHPTDKHNRVRRLQRGWRVVGPSVLHFCRRRLQRDSGQALA